MHRKPVTLNGLLRWLGLPARDQDLVLSAIATDSRQLVPGSLFVALPGVSADGADYVDSAVAAGAAAVLLPMSAPEPDVVTVPVIRVEALLARAGGLFDFWFGSPSRELRILGVTGTNGKTSSVHCMATLLERLGIGCGLMGTLGQGRRGAMDASVNTTPDLLSCHGFVARMRDAGLDWIAMEVSSHALEQGRTEALVIDTAVFTNLSRDHLDYHGSMEAYARAKARLFSRPGLRHAIVNLDDPWTPFLRRHIPDAVQCLTFSLESAQADIWLDAVECDSAGGRGWLTTPWGQGELRTGLLGAFNLYNLLGVLGALGCQGFSVPDLLQQVPSIEAPPGRLSIYGGGALPRVLVDYAHTPAALEQALQVARTQARGRLLCVFGCGGGRDPGKRVPMAEVACRLADQVFCTADNPRFEEPAAIIEQMLVGLSAADCGKIRPLVDRAQAIQQAIAVAAADDCVLVAGKGHENYQEIRGMRYPFSDEEHVRRALAGREQ